MLPQAQAMKLNGHIRVHRLELRAQLRFSFFIRSSRVSWFRYGVECNTNVNIS